MTALKQGHLYASNLCHLGSSSLVMYVLACLVGQINIMTGLEDVHVFGLPAAGTHLCYSKLPKKKNNN